MKKKVVKIVLMAAGVILINAGLCACSTSSKPQGYGKVNLTLNNKVSDQISVLGASWLIGDDAVHSTGVEVAGGGKCLGEEPYSFCITTEDIETEEELQKLAVKIKVTEKEGNTVELEPLSLPSKWGDMFEYYLYCEDGNYYVEKCE